MDAQEESNRSALENIMQKVPDGKSELSKIDEFSDDDYFVSVRERKGLSTIV